MPPISRLSGLGMTELAIQLPGYMCRLTKQPLSRNEKKRRFL